MCSDCACVLGHARRSTCFQKQSVVPVPQVSASFHWRRRATAGLSPQGLGFSLVSVHIRSVVDKVALIRVSLRLLHFPLPGSFHQCNISFLHLLPTLFNLKNSQRRSKLLKIDSLRTPKFRQPITAQQYKHIGADF